MNQLNCFAQMTSRNRAIVVALFLAIGIGGCSPGNESSGVKSTAATTDDVEVAPHSESEATADEEGNRSVESGDVLPNAIRPIEQDIAEDSLLEINETNTEWIQSVRSRVLLSGVSFNESFLASASANHAEISFERPEATYNVTVYETETNVTVYAANLGTDGAERSPEVMDEIIEVASLLAGVAASMLDEPSSKQLRFITTSSEFKELFHKALIGDDVERDFECGDLVCRLINPPVDTPRIEFLRLN